MKAFLTGILVGVVIATAAAFVLDREFQRGGEQRYQTQGVRL